MQTHFDCLACIVRQCIDSLRAVTDDADLHERILREVFHALSEIDYRQPPPVMGQRIHRRIRELTGKVDPYRDAKQSQNQLALELVEQLRGEFDNTSKPLELAVRMAVAGNVVDLGAKSGLTEAEIRAEIGALLTKPLEGNIRHFADTVAEATSILYLTDNAGEIVFDRVLVEQLPFDRVTVAVRGLPVINDATLADAETAGLTDIVDVISNGSDAPGTLLDDCSETFRSYFEEADLIIAKGQGNYETLAESPRPIYFLLRVKCPVVQCPVGSMVMRPSDALMNSSRKEARS
jgi:uncharacterized protein with ATP-grasp and redox domains